jgi:hypothetical protein
VAEHPTEQPTTIAEIEEIRSRLIDRFGPTSMSEIPDDTVGAFEAMEYSSRKSALGYELIRLLNLIDSNIETNSSLQLLQSLELVVNLGLKAGTYNPDQSFMEWRKDEKVKASVRKRITKRKANIAAQDRRNGMRPFVNEIMKDFDGVDGYSKFANAICSGLMKQSGFKAILPKSVKPRQIKDDLKAILTAIDDSSQVNNDHALDANWDEPFE